MDQAVGVFLITVTYYSIGSNLNFLQVKRMLVTNHRRNLGGSRLFFLICLTLIKKQ